jgi:hypothetical protein
VQARTERILLVITGIALLAFAVSFALGVRLRSASSDGVTPDSIAARDFLNRGRPPRVEVLNGAGRSGLAREVTGQLRESGFDVVFFGNARGQTDTTYVLDRTGRIETARAVARALGVERVHTAIDTTLYLEATVVLGKDWPE